MNGLFFTGTDTGVGKTFTMASVARQLRRQGRVVRVCKPVATGAALIDGRWRSADSLRLAEAVAAGPADLDSITPWAYPDPVAPPVAARRHGDNLNLLALAGAVRNQYAPGGVILVEGVGGLLCPLTDQGTVADLAAELALPVVVVARRGLGTLNHTLLTLEAARHRHIRVAGVVINESERDQTLAAATNPDELRRRIDVPILAVVPPSPSPLHAPGGEWRVRGDAPEIPSEPIPALAGVDWWALANGRQGGQV